MSEDLSVDLLATEMRLHKEDMMRVENICLNKMINLINFLL